MTNQTTPLRDRIAAALYDHSHPGWAISFPDLDQEQRDTYLARADAALAELPRRTAGDVAAVIGPTMLLGLQDAELDGEGGTQRIHDWIKWISEAVAALPAVLPTTTNHDTDTAPAATCSAQYHGPGEDRARLCIRAAQHQRTAHTDEHGFHWSDTVAMYPVADGTFRIGTDVRAELRRVADETAATETQAATGACTNCRGSGLDPRYNGDFACPDCQPAPEPAAGARQDGAQR